MDKEFIEKFGSCAASARSCKFNSTSDVEKVLDGLAVNLPDAVRTGVVKNVDIPDSQNGLTSPADITGRVYDNFDAVDRMKELSSLREEHKSNVARKAAADAAAAAAAAAAGE